MIKYKMNIPSLDDLLTYSLWTDGSCNLNVSAGYGIVIADYQNNIISQSSGTIKNHFTAPHAELVAVVEGIKLLLSIVKNPIIKVYSDSEFVVKTMNLWGPTRKSWSGKAHADLFIPLLEFAKNTNITFTHVPGHKGIGFNELADQLAKKGNIKI